jgi:Mat/Ecp fimbriae major subunit
MTNRFAKAALAATVAAAAFAATSAQAATATADAKAQILRQITVTKTADLDFGTIVTGAAASTVVISPAGVRTCGVGLVCTNAVTAAGFGIVGTVGQVVTIASDPTVTLASGANNMSATLLTSAATRTLTGTDAFTVGGTLAVGANQADGAYTGTFTVTVNYL